MKMPKTNHKKRTLAQLRRDIDLTDFDRLAHFFDASGRFGPNEWWEGNFDGDDDVDITDFNFLASNFAPDGYGTSAIPEPSAMLLALLGLILLGRAPVK